MTEHARAREQQGENQRAVGRDSLNPTRRVGARRGSGELRARQHARTRALTRVLLTASQHRSITASQPGLPGSPCKRCPARACAAHHDRLAVIAEAVKDLDLGPAKGHGGARRTGAPRRASATTASTNVGAKSA